MPTPLLRRIALLSIPLCLCGALLAPARAEAPPAADLSKVSAEMAAAATKLWDSLTDEQKAAAGFEFADNERTNWHFIPKPRKGLTLKLMTEPQRVLAKALLTTGLSETAAAKVYQIMSLEQILHDMEAGKGNTPERDTEKYFWSIFGKPGTNQPWGWRVEGHHCSMNFTIINDKAVAAGPAFMGDNPAEVKEGPRKGLRVLADEEDMGRALVKSLTDEQKAKGILKFAAPKEIVTGADRQAVLKDFQGVPASDLTEAQKTALSNLIALYANRLRPELAQADIHRIAQAGLAKVYFAWAGETEPGQPHYYRIHGPTFLVEYDDTQNNANHIHTVWRDLENDFGGDILKKHYQEAKDHK